HRRSFRCRALDPRAAATRSPHPDLRRAAPVELPALGGGLRRALFQRHAVARFRSARARRGHQRLSEARAALWPHLGADPPHRDQRRVSNLLARFLTAVVAIPILLLAIWWRDPSAVYAIVFLATGLGLREWTHMTMSSASGAERGLSVSVGLVLSSLL